MSPVFAFDVSVVVGVVRPGAGVLDRDFSVEEITHESLVEKLVAVVAIEAENGERQ
ncbi:MAG: hypothetical protein HYZ83_01970 [Candidatus Omnitrophica bacterium]|nr:hypothetical protein [Candidatus Omnitrophota bacterium]